MTSSIVGRSPSFVSRLAAHEGEDDVSLFARMSAGEPEAFEVVVRLYGPRLLVVARRMLGCEAEAADALQEGFLSAFQSLASFRGDSRLSTWLHRIIVNACLMRLRSQKRRPAMRIEDLLPRFDETGHRIPDRGHPSPQRHLETSELRQQVRQCIDQLPYSFREILLLRDIEELDTAETARLLDVSEAVVKTRLHRARQALRTLLEPMLGIA
jgi:RNA polymerase sigma-70 factor (ECF subfamily)